MTPVRRFLVFAVFALCAFVPALVHATPARAGEEEHATVLDAARAFHRAVDSGDPEKVAAFGATAKGPFTAAERAMELAGCRACLERLKGKPWELGQEYPAKDVEGAWRVQVKAGDAPHVLLTAKRFQGAWYVLGVDDLVPELFLRRDPPVVDPTTAAPSGEGPKAVLEAVLAAARRDDPDGKSFADRLLWHRYGLRTYDADLVGPLMEMLAHARAAKVAPRVADAPAAGGGPADKHAVLRVDVGDRAYEVLLVLETAWFLVRAWDLRPAGSAPKAAERKGAGEVGLSGPDEGLTGGGALVAASREEAAAARAAAERLLAALDAADTRAFAAGMGEAGPGGVKPSDAKGLDPTVETLHQRYGARPRRLGRVEAEASAAGVRRLAVPVLVGDAEDLLWMWFQAHEGRWWLVSLSEGSPEGFVPDEGTTPPK